MTLRAAQPGQEFQRMCKQAERDHESKKLAVLIERLRRQIAHRENFTSLNSSRKPAVSVLSPDNRLSHTSIRSTLLES
jgi:hypothetical protein